MKHPATRKVQQGILTGQCLNDKCHDCRYQTTQPHYIIRGTQPAINQRIGRVLLIAKVKLDPTVAISSASFLNVKELGIMRKLIINAFSNVLKRAPMKHDNQKQVRLRAAPSAILKDPTKDKEIADSLLLKSAVCSIPQVPVHPFNMKLAVEHAKTIVHP